MTEWEGVLPVWKEAGMTSHDCVSQARKLLRMKRIGHTGTLDPDVSGVLPLCLGRATRIVEYLQELPKVYEAEMTIGYATDTEDAGGTEIARVASVRLSEPQIREAVMSRIGNMSQTPPMYSAVKIDGKRLYEWARQGIEVERQPRTVTVYAIDIAEVRLNRPYPEIRMTVACSKGTYIRTLCVDIGRQLGYPAVMTSLVRVASGPFRREHAVSLPEAERQLAGGELHRMLIPIGDALSFMPGVIVPSDFVQAALHGRKLASDEVRPSPDAAASKESSLLRCYGETGTDELRFLGVYRWEPGDGTYAPVKLFT